MLTDTILHAVASRLGDDLLQRHVELGMRGKSATSRKTIRDLDEIVAKRLPTSEIMLWRIVYQLAMLRNDELLAQIIGKKLVSDPDYKSLFCMDALKDTIPLSEVMGQPIGIVSYVPKIDQIINKTLETDRIERDRSGSKPFREKFSSR